MIIIPVNGLNTRMGGLFRTPKHLLKVDGIPALKRTVDYMSNFGEITILAGEKYYGDIDPYWLPENCTVKKVKPTTNVIETIFQGLEVDKEDDLFIVDCDVIPTKLNRPHGSTVYVFDNERGPNQYSNFDLVDGKIFDCNEKGEKFRYAGAGVYYFSKQKDFVEHSHGCKSVSEVVSNLSEWAEIAADTSSKIERIGTLPDITGGFTTHKLVPTITKLGNTARDEFNWYRDYEDKKDIPAILAKDLPGHSLTMEFIQAEGHLNIFSVIELVEKYKRYRRMNDLQFEVYRDRVKRHLDNNPIYGGEKLLEILKEQWIEPTFSHGDLSVTNIIQTKTGPRFIDPLYSECVFGSHYLDYAKLLFSLKFYNNDLGNFDLLYNLLDLPVNMNALIAAECVRVATYNKKFNFIAENLINEL